MTIRKLSERLGIEEQRIRQLLGRGIVPQNIVKRQRKSRGGHTLHSVNESVAFKWFLAFFALWEIGLEEEEIPKILSRVSVERVGIFLKSKPFPDFLHFLRKKKLIDVPWKHLPAFLDHFRRKEWV